jgi:hypothetical protein
MDAPGGNYRADFALLAGTNWTTTSYTLNQGAFDTGGGRLPKSAFTTNYNVTALRFQAQIENAASGTDWGFDTDNVLIVDNLKLERIYVGCPPLTIVTSGVNLVVTWAPPSTGTVKLQSAPAPNGAWTEVPGATSPYTTPAAGAPKYFRTIWVPPAQ